MKEEAAQLYAKTHGLPPLSEGSCSTLPICARGCCRNTKVLGFIGQRRHHVGRLVGSADCSASFNGSARGFCVAEASHYN